MGDQRGRPLCYVKDQNQWQQQRDERMSDLVRQLETGVQAIQTSADFKRYLQIAATFHQYSPNNVLLILSQRPDATRVAGYTTWQSLGRQVKKGEKAIYIFAPRPYRVTTEDEAGEEQTREGLTFRSVPVFDISQTEGAPILTMEAPTLTGDAGQATYQALVAFAAHEGLTVTTHDPKTDGDDTQSTYNGYYSPSRKLIFVKPAAPAHMVKTLAHELAHHLDPELQTVSRAECETVAEATAFVVAAHADIDTGSYSFPYIATWASRQDGPALLKHVMGRVQAIAHRVIAGITPEDQRAREDPDHPTADRLAA